MESGKYRLFNYIFLPLVGLNLMSIALFNLAVDPYGILKNLTAPDDHLSNLENTPSPVPKPVNKEEENQAKPPTTLEQRNKYRADRFKINLATLSITSIQPKTIFLGTSTALKLSTEHPALTIQPAYNLALPGAKMHDIKSYFDDTLANHPDLKEVIVSLDFFAFGGPKKEVKAAPEKVETVTVVRTNKYSVSLPELLKINFSVDTLKASIKKIMPTVPFKQEGGEKLPQADGQKKPISKVLSARLSKKNVKKLEAKKNQKKRQKKEAKKLQDNKKIKKPEVKAPKVKAPVVKAPVVKPPVVKAPVVKPPVVKAPVVKPPVVKPPVVKPPVVNYKNSERLNNFKRVMTLYLQEKTLYKNYNLSEEEMENFKAIVETCKKRNISLKVFISPVHAAQLEIIHSAGLWPAFEEWKRQIINITPAWDFSDYTGITTEPIDDQMENFVDSVHYQDRIAELILYRIYNYRPERVPSNFGVFVTPEKIETHLKTIREQRQKWRQNNPETVKFVQDVKKESNLKK